MSENPPLLNAARPAFSSDAGSTVATGWQQQDSVLRDLWIQNKTPQEISSILGRSVPAIMTRAARLGLPRRTAPGRKPGAGAEARRLPSAHDASGSEDLRRSTASLGPKNPQQSKPETQVQESLRICLMCLKKFPSEGRHNRICMPCKGSAEYHRASTLSDVQLPNV